MENTQLNKAPDISAAINTLAAYKRAKRDIEAALLAEREIWRAVYEGNESSSWIFNSIVNKHADVIDNMPRCTCLPREKRDEKSAAALSKIIPVITERSGFDKTYSDNAWDKIKHGTAVYGVFWNTALEGGLGDIDIRPISISDIFWEIGVSDIQDSKNVFLAGIADVECLEAQYPHFSYAEQREATSSLATLLGYTESEGKCVVVDWYYKKYGENGEPILHFCKLAGNCILFSSETAEGYDSGWYAHGKYPFVFDRLYPLEGGLCGFGMISVSRPIQGYINRLDENIMSYSDWASRVRFWAKRSLGVNEKEFLDLDRSIVEVEGDINEEKLRQIEIGQMDNSIIDIKRLKIEELKEVTGSRDVSQGGITGSITAASAITILRETSAKFSRDGIEESHRAYVKVITLVIDLIRQFYTTARVFRITGEDGACEYFSFSGKELKYAEGSRPFFDIEVVAHKKTPTEAQSKNELAERLFEAGAFKKENAKETLMMLELMDFEGIGKLRAHLKSLCGEGI